MAKRKPAEAPVLYPVVLKGMKGGGPGDFDARVKTPDGVVVEAPIARREVAAKCDAYDGQTQPEHRAALRFYNSILAAFPGRGATFEELAAFAQEAEIDLSSDVQTAAAAWRVLFGEANDMAHASAGAETVTAAPEYPEEDDAETDVAAADGDPVAQSHVPDKAGKSRLV